MNKSDCVRVYFEIGHEASLRNKRTIEGFTHDWEVYVRGVDNAEIHHFIEKVVFHLHDTFPKPKRTIKEPPYCLKESGYAGFNLPIDIYLKNKDEHRKLRFFYDLTLQPSGPRLTKSIKEKADFANPPEDFRRKLIRGGGVGVGGNDSTTNIEKTNSITPNSHGDDSKSSPHSGKPKLSNNISDQPKKHKPKESSKPEELKGNSFAALFGTPIKTTKHSPTSKPAPKSSSSSEIKNSHEKQAKDSSKIPKHSPHKEKEKDKENSLSKYKDKERDKERDVEKSNKDKDRNKEKEHKEKERSKDKLPKKSISPLPPKDIRKEENTKRPPEENNKERISSKNDNVKEKKHKEKKHKDEREKKEIHKEHDKKEFEKEKIEKKQDIKEKDIKEIKFKSIEKEEKKSKPSDREKDRSHDTEKQKHKHKRKEKHRKEDEKDRHKKKAKEEKTPEPTPPPKAKSPTPPPPPPPPPPPAPPKPAINPLDMLIHEMSDKDSDSDFSVTMEEDIKTEPPIELPPKVKVEEKKIEIREEREKIKKKEKKNKDDEKESRKRKRKIKDKEEPLDKVIKAEVKEELIEKSPPKREERSSESPEAPLFTEEYVSQLRDLQQKIMTLQDNADLQHIVQVVSETGHFEITQRTFDFDLCTLDRSTVKRLQDMFITAS